MFKYLLSAHAAPHGSQEDRGSPRPVEFLATRDFSLPNGAQFLGAQGCFSLKIPANPLNRKLLRDFALPYFAASGSLIEGYGPESIIPSFVDADSPEILTHFAKDERNAPVLEKMAGELKELKTDLGVRDGANSAKMAITTMLVAYLVQTGQVSRGDGEKFLASTPLGIGESTARVFLGKGTALWKEKGVEAQSDGSDIADSRRGRDDNDRIGHHEDGELPG